MKKENWIIALAAGAGVAAVAYALLRKNSLPADTTVVQPFDRNRYLGKWHEIARLPSILEKGLSKLTEEYLPNNDGTIKVITRAYNASKDKWNEFTGKAKSAGAEDKGLLKVSYFGPVYLDYYVLDIDADYKYALVSGSSLDYLWILSRETTISDDIKERFIERAREIGFAVEKLEWPTT